MNSLNFNRTLLISGNLPADEMRKIKLIASSDIDTGNNLLGLDMVVRDENGDILDTNSICTTELYEHHMNTVNRIIKASVRSLMSFFLFFKFFYVLYNIYITVYYFLAIISIF